MRFGGRAEEDDGGRGEVGGREWWCTVKRPERMWVLKKIWAREVRAYAGGNRLDTDICSLWICPISSRIISSISIIDVRSKPL